MNQTMNGDALPRSTKAIKSSIEDQSEEQADIQVSDLDSDLELDELIPAYLKIKGKLYEIDPMLVETAARKQSKGTKSKKAVTGQATQGPATRKLLSQLQQITSDALFDEYEAEALWPAKRNQIAQDRANKRQEQGDQPTASSQIQDVVAPAPPVVLMPDLSTTNPDSADSEDEADLLGGMFTAVSEDVQPRQPDADNSLSDTAILRDFGKSSGLTPRRLLEEAVRSRSVEPQCVLCTQAYARQGPKCTLDVQDDLTYHLLLSTFLVDILVQSPGL
jgi:ATP-dependent RNA helicase DHX29